MRAGVHAGTGGSAQVGDRFNPEVGFLRRRAYPAREPLQPQLSAHAAALAPPHPAAREVFSVYTDLHNRLESSQGHWHFFDIMTRPGARFGYLFETQQDRIARVSGRHGPNHRHTRRRVRVDPRRVGGHTNLSAPISAMLWHRIGHYYNGDYLGWQLTIGPRAGARLHSEIGWNRDDITLPGGSFRNDLVPAEDRLRVHQPRQPSGTHSIQPAGVGALVEHPAGAAQSQRHRFFVVYNDRRDTPAFTSDELLGRSFLVKYTRQLDY